MNPATIIAKKRDGQQLTPDEIHQFVTGYASDHIPDYQMAALAMAIFLNGMQPAEVACLTQEMLHSGDILAWPDDGVPRVDSTLR